MSLTKYRKKRKFNDTPEPSGQKEGSAGELKFVVQKHDASRLHYDFRLEMKGVLKSWAVPKGPSLNPDDKRLAMMVEDHPYTYKDFEGTIPEGNYGAGTVIVWDEGSYEPLEPVNGGRRAQENQLLQGLHKGDLKFVLHGKKLKGAWVLVHTKGRGENAWLLIKKRDQYAKESDITRQGRSVVSGKTIEQIAKTSTNEWHSNRNANGRLKDQGEASALATSKVAKKSSVKRAIKQNSSAGKALKAGSAARTITKQNSLPGKTVKKKSAGIQSGEKKSAGPNGNKAGRITSQSNKIKYIDPRVQKGTKTSFPADLTPMLATLTDHPFDSPDWIFEIKWDGYRALAYCRNDKIELRSRNNISFTEKYLPVTEALATLGLHAVLDGEIVSMNEQGRSDFQQLQIWQKQQQGDLQYYLFDLLWLEGYSLIELPLMERKAILKDIIPAHHPVIKYSDHLEESGREFFELAHREGLEGIMAKLASGTYHPGIRTQQWLKVKTEQRQEAIICGFTAPRRSRKMFGALVLGMYDKGELQYIGHTGSGFNEKSLREIYKMLGPIVTDKCPFSTKPVTNMPCTWVKPKYVCEVKYTEWTKDGLLRHPIFQGLREDKKATEVKKEMPVDARPEKIEKQERAAKRTPAAADKEAKTKQTRKKKSGGSAPVAEGPLFTGTQKDQVVTLNGHEIKCTNLNKFYWPQEKITKRSVIEYYHDMAPVILPYMKDRPQSLNRYPEGTDGPNFFQKDVAGRVAPWLSTYSYTSESDHAEKKFLVCTDEASLIYMANLGCIEMNPWHSRTGSAGQPDWCVIDLDPDKIDFETVVETAQVVKQVTGELGMPTCCKTSGSRGLHIYIPLAAKYTYDQSRQLAEMVVTIVNQELPAFTSLERNPSRRKGKIYLDFLQNRSIQTIAAPYSLRPKPGATVSAPLHWEEVRKGLSISAFTLFNIRDRVKEMGDIFKGVLGKGIHLGEVLKRAASLTNS